MKRIGLTAFLLVGLLALAGATWADGSLNTQLFRPSIFGGNFIMIDDAHTLSTLGFHIGALVNYTDSLLTDYEDEEPNFDYITQMFTLNGMLALGTIDWLSLGVDVPINFARKRYVKNPEFGLVETPDMVKDEDLDWNTELGDIRAALKFRILDEKTLWLGMALTPYVMFPTGNGHSYLGEDRYTFGGTLSLEHDFGPLNIGLNGGYHYRNIDGPVPVFNTEVGDAIKWGAGISHDWDMGLGLGVEYQGSYYMVEDTDVVRNMPMEVIGVLRYKFGARGPRLIVGAGPGVTTGVGAPAYRVLGGIDYTYSRPEPTEGSLTIYVVDQNGKSLAADVTITAADGAKIQAMVDGSWKTSLKAGTYQIRGARDGYNPDAKDAKIEVKGQSEVKLVLTEIEKVKPTLLTLRVVDKATGKKLDAEVTFDAGSAKQKKMNVPGEISQEWAVGTHMLTVRTKGYETRCNVAIEIKEKHNNIVTVEMSNKIEYRGTIEFAVASAVLRPESYTVLDEVVAKIKSLCEWEKITVAGHTSSEGTDEYNMKLSKNRAESVRKYLVSKGIDAAKLDSAGFGESKPIADNTTEAGRAKNRRVEFVVQ